jgi:hypothetical protein
VTKGHTKQRLHHAIESINQMHRDAQTTTINAHTMAKKRGVS